MGYSGSGSFTQTGGTNNLPNGMAPLFVGFNPGSSGSYSLSGLGVLTATAGEYVGVSGNGMFTQSGGTQQLQRNPVSGQHAGSSGSYTLSSAAVLSTHAENVGYYGAGTFAQSGGMNTCTGNLYLGFYAGSSGTYNQSGGTNNVYPSTGNLYLGGNAGSSGAYNLNGTAFLSAGSEYVGNNGSGTFTQSGGTNAVGSLFLAEYTGSAGTYNLSGGLLTLGYLNEGIGAAVFNISGGTFQAGTSYVQTLWPIVLSMAGSNGVFDTQGNSMTLSGSLSGPGGLRKIGSGTLTLTNSNTYTGTTVVSNGTLILVNTAGLAGSTFDTSGAGSLSFGSTSAAFGGLQGSGNLALTNPAAVSERRRQ